MLKRKIEQTLWEWKDNTQRKPLVIMGIRQCGKTFIVQEFADKAYGKENVVYINFVKQPERTAAFLGAKDVDSIILKLSAQIRTSRFTPHKTCIILDEIQDCPDARTALKFFKEDGRYDIIATGSLLGVQGYGSETKKVHRKLVSETSSGKNSIPVGYEQIVQMFPLDFEEFLWAHNMPQEVIDVLKECLRQESPVPEAIHIEMKKLLLRYIAVGGLPAAVNKLLETGNIGKVNDIHHSILKEYRDDMVKYAADEGKARIRECFDSIPKHLSKENKKFQYSVVRKGGRSAMYLGSLQWLEDAGIIMRCYNLTETGLPLEGYADKDVFKVYVSDIGLLVSMLGDATRADILNGHIDGFKGAIFENLMADTLIKKQQNLYYYHKESGMELDFLIRHNGNCVPIEVKATSNQAKSLSTVLKNTDKYHIAQAIKFGDYNIGRNGNMLTLPFYMEFLLNLEPEDIALEKIDTDALINAAREFRQKG
ncbi:MAG: ATP-binding protein [Paludibacteraceae bacterium]|nr:ATP-binding protein [Paludibacteraceae bacterium]